MKKILLLIAFAGFVTALSAQTAPPKKAYQIYQTQYIKPKHGKETQFEAAVKAHNAKFHATGPHSARLSVITTGSGSDGWYVWAMGPFMYPDLDHAPAGEKTHDDDWTNNIDPLVDQYGETTNWKLDEDISITPADYKPENIDVWTMDVKPGMRAKFADNLKMMAAVWKAKKYPYSFRVFNNDLFSSNGKDVSIVYSFKNYTEFDMDFKFKEDYESINGAGSWQKFWDTWNECTSSTDEHFRKFLK
jgi:hypothetical protein